MRLMTMRSMTGRSMTGRSITGRVTTLRRSGAAALTAAAVATALVPASAASSPSPVGAASVYGLDHNFRLVGHTDLAKRGMNSPIAVAGKCVYVGDRYYSGSAQEPVRPNGGVGVIDTRKPPPPPPRGTLAPAA